MPRSIQEILDHADELTERFENYEPADGDERPIEEYLLERAALDRARSEGPVIDSPGARLPRSLSCEDVARGEWNSSCRVGGRADRCRRRRLFGHRRRYRRRSDLDPRSDLVG